jgi:hypothetical protein
MAAQRSALCCVFRGFAWRYEIQCSLVSHRRKNNHPNLRRAIFARALAERHAPKMTPYRSIPQGVQRVRDFWSSRQRGPDERDGIASREP